MIMPSKTFSYVAQLAHMEISLHCAVFSPRLSQGMLGGRGLGVVCRHIKAFGLIPFPHQRSISAEGLQGQENTVVFFPDTQLNYQ